LGKLYEKNTYIYRTSKFFTYKVLPHMGDARTANE